MNHANSSLAKTEIIKQLGYFPAFLFPAIKSSLVYQSLAQQTLFAYANNPLPSTFKEKLFVVLSRYYGISYLTICHSCTLRSLGLSGADVLALGELQYPQSEADVAEDLKLLSRQRLKETGWYNSELETSLLRCACLLFLHPEQTANLSASLKDLLGTIYYHYLIVLLGYIKLCHQWLKSNKGIKHQQDRRSQLHLGSLLLEEIRLAEFFQTVPQLSSAPQTCPQPASSQLSARASRHSTAAEIATPQLRQKTLTTCLANAPFPVMIHDRQGKIIHLNRNWLEASGYDLEEISTIEEWNQKAQIEQREIVRLPAKNPSQLYQKYVAPAHKTAMEATTTLQQIINSLIEIAPEATKTKVRSQRITEAIRSEVKGTTKSGDRLCWELYSTALSFDETDELVISIAKDITEVVRYEARLSEVEAKLRSVLSATKAGIWSWDLTTNRVDVCRQGRIILGLKNFDGNYESLLQSIHPKQRESIDLEIARAIQADRDLDIKYSVVKSDRQVALIHAKGKLNYNSLKQPASIEGVLLDITSSQITPADIPSLSFADEMPTANSAVDSAIALKNMAQSLCELETIIDLLPCYLFVVNIKTKAISLINAGWVNSLNLDMEEATGRTIADCFPTEYAHRIAKHHQQAIDSQQVLQVQEEVALPDGVHYFDTVVTPLYDDEGDIYALLHTCCDIPNFAATQEALSQRTIQLEAANRELESFSYSVSHDLQAPLRIINGFSQVLWENYQPNLDQRGKHYLQRIQANSKRMSDLIDALLQLSRVTRSQMKPIEVDLSAIAKDIIEELRVDNQKRQVEVKIAMGAKAKGDPQLLRIVLNNLLHNAWKYTSKRSHSQIEFGVVATAAKPTFFVKDNGAGFDPEYADKLFVPFQRLHSQTEFPGTGIGLATVQRIIYRHGGKVWAEGECDRGVTVYFSL